MSVKRDLVEIFGYGSDDLTADVRTLWRLGGCPFVGKGCIKINHDQTIIYGTCSVTSPYGDIIICPNRLYADNYQILRKISADAFPDVPFLFYDQYLEKRASVDDCVVVLGKNSGKEIQVGKSLSMDWVLAYISRSELKEYVGLEVQSIDITGNYRDAWHAYKNLKPDTDRRGLPSSKHGLNWANVHKRLIPQLIRKGLVYSKSNLVKKGLYFVLPDIVYLKFEDILGKDIPKVDMPSQDTLTVYTYEIGPVVNPGHQRALVEVRKMRFTMGEFANRFISGPLLPSGEELDHMINKALGFIK